jgi:hypothetical protein
MGAGMAAMPSGGVREHAIILEHRRRKPGILTAYPKKIEDIG